MRLACHTRAETLDEDLYPAIEQLAHEAQTVEAPFDKPLIQRLMGHNGAHLLLAFDERQQHAGRLIGLSWFFVDPESFPQEAEDLAREMAEYLPFCWMFYVIVHTACQGVLVQLVRHSERLMADGGCRWVVADYMLRPTPCIQGRRLMELAGFQDTGREYGAGLRDAEHQDVYRVMVREIGGGASWRRKAS